MPQGEVAPTTTAPFVSELAPAASHVGRGPCRAFSPGAWVGSAAQRRAVRADGGEAPFARRQGPCRPSALRCPRVPSLPGAVRYQPTLNSSTEMRPSAL
jgi:hypothetical protein